MAEQIPIIVREVVQTDQDLERIVHQVAALWIDAQKTTFFPLIRRTHPMLFLSLNADAAKILSTKRLKKALLCKLKNRFKLIIATQEEKVVGYATVIPLHFNDEVEDFLEHACTGECDDLSDAEKALMKNNLSSEELYIDELMVHSSAQRRGVGTAILNYIFDDGHRHGYVRCTLTSLEKNEKASQFYEKLSFKKEKFFLNPDNVSIIIFIKKIL